MFEPAFLDSLRTILHNDAQTDQAAASTEEGGVRLTTAGDMELGLERAMPIDELLDTVKLLGEKTIEGNSLYAELCQLPAALSDKGSAALLQDNAAAAELLEEVEAARSLMTRTRAALAQLKSDQVC